MIKRPIRHPSLKGIRVEWRAGGRLKHVTETGCAAPQIRAGVFDVDSHFPQNLRSPGAGEVGALPRAVTGIGEKVGGIVRGDPVREADEAGEGMDKGRFVRQSLPVRPSVGEPSSRPFCEHAYGVDGAVAVCGLPQ